MQKFLKSLLIGLTLLFLLSGIAAAAESDPVKLLNGLADQMIAGLNQHKATLKSNPGFVYSLANRIVVPHADLDVMSKRVLPPAEWNKASPAQRAAFKKAFTMTLIRTYSSALAAYSDQTVKFYPVRGGYEGKNQVEVESNILQANGPSISVNYRVIKSGSSWLLYDLIVDGVSMLQNFQSQFADILQNGDLTALTNALNSHNAKNGSDE